ncbi:MAG: type II toxin-antitoxin system mRNA interferase toxin, RelE/StbE family [bacterium (Candidatus Ratteibacteria) CG23_combo_of_CG06-09_8_20_14_all_48_7]|uniref:Type II toxin-antitoxin system mRNA interferase toxin, RelE/StbE family n=1 Tax=bacterium (Candidatus Ratteibacteria) CG23_combo_of_CG06-09_8_20_14_all_48_7 TaxID=2014292 RepID=A0A2G9YAS4_9BACT|nr:MAG: type II toxin-antitoxin system mRNA interferase toxin, RelE/StbE family [bacterium (Candidatus Ratteibacteria) CG23_combo_of_CG06-09_8_20_14_all_48_7]
MKKVSQTTQFLRDVRKLRKRGNDLEKLKVVVHELAEGKPIDRKYHEHHLNGEWKNSRDCHIEPDWVLIYTIDAISLRLERTGSHSDLFG